MQDEVATGGGFGPACVGHEVGGGEGERLARWLRAACLEHGAHAGFTIERTHRGPHAIAGVQQLQDAVCADESRTAGDQDQFSAHAGLLVDFPILMVDCTDLIMRLLKFKKNDFSRDAENAKKRNA